MEGGVRWWVMVDGWGWGMMLGEWKVGYDVG